MDRAAYKPSVVRSPTSSQSPLLAEILPEPRMQDLLLAVSSASNAMTAYTYQR